MSAHNHDDEIINRMNKASKAIQSLRRKVAKAKGDAIVNAVLNTNIKGLSKEEALKKLENAIDDAVDGIAGE